MSLPSCLEAILFASAERMSFRRLAELVQADEEDVRVAIQALAERLTQSGSGIQVLQHGEGVELVTRPEYAETVRAAVHAEAASELTKPSLETLSILAYRGPLTRPELEQIRGVQSALILRNLVMRGLVEVKEEIRMGQPIYTVTADFLKHLGVDGVESLPEYEALHQHPIVQQVLAELDAPTLPADEGRMAT